MALSAALTADWRCSSRSVAYLTKQRAMLATFSTAPASQPNRTMSRRRLLGSMLGSRALAGAGAARVRLALPFLCWRSPENSGDIAIPGPSSCPTTGKHHRVSRRHVGHRNLPGRAFSCRGPMPIGQRVYAGAAVHRSSWSWLITDQQLGSDAAFCRGEARKRDARISLDWLKATCGGACVRVRRVPDFWKPYAIR